MWVSCERINTLRMYSADVKPLHRPHVFRHLVCREKECQRGLAVEEVEAVISERIPVRKLLVRGYTRKITGLQLCNQRVSSA